MSASSNAKNNFGMKKNKLFVQSAYCEMGPVLKRYRPRAQGKGFRIKKPMSHITIVLSEIN
jgi:large subunit ribosomal protein L22